MFYQRNIEVINVMVLVWELEVCDICRVLKYVFLVVNNISLKQKFRDGYLGGMVYRFLSGERGYVSLCLCMLKSQRLLGKIYEVKIKFIQNECFRRYLYILMSRLVSMNSE